MEIMRAYYKCICSDGTASDFKKGCPVHDPAMKVADMGRNYDALEQRVKALEDQLHKSSADWLERCKKFRKQDADEYEAELSTLRAERDALKERVNWFESSGGVAAHVKVFELRAKNELLQKGNERLREALKLISGYGKDGICPYGCDCPDIAHKALGGGA